MHGSLGIDLFGGAEKVVSDAQALVSDAGKKIPGILNDASTAAKQATTVVASANKTAQDISKTAQSADALVNEAKLRMQELEQTNKAVNKAADDTKSTMNMVQVVSVLLGVCAIGGLYVYAKRR